MSVEGCPVTKEARDIMGREQSESRKSIKYSKKLRNKTKPKPFDP